MFRPVHVLKRAPRGLAFLAALAVCGATSAHAQGVFSITSEFEVGGSTLYATATGLDPVDVDAQGLIRVAWHKAPVPGAGFEYQNEFISPADFQKGVFVSTYSMSGVPVQEPIRVDDPELAGWAQDPVLAVDDLGRFVVLWRQAEVDDDGVGALRAIYSLWMRPFDAQGIPLDAPRPLTNETRVLPSIDMAGSGEFVIVLGRTEPEDEDNFDKEPPRFWRFDADFQPVDEIPRAVDTTLGQNAYSVVNAVALNETGDFAVAYADSLIVSNTRSRRLRLRVFAPDGAPISEPVLIESTFVWGLKMKWLDRDRFVAAWLEGGRLDPITGNWQVFSKDGSPVGSRIVSDTARGPGDILAFDDTGFAVVWATESGAVLIPSTATERAADIPLAISKAVSYWSYTDYYYGLEKAASPMSVAALGNGQFAAVFMNTLDGREAVRAGILDADIFAEPATFEWSVTGPCVADRMATVRLNWSSAANDAEIIVAGPPADKLFARVKGSGVLETGLWARHGMVFKLYDQASGELLATTKARPDADSCPFAPIIIEPQVFEVCDPRELSAGEVMWDVTDVSPAGAEIRVNGIDGKLFARGGPVGSATTGQWLRNGMLFYLLNPSTSDFLGTATVQYQQRACP